MPIVTPGGHYLGGRRDRPDVRDFRYSATHLELLPDVRSVDLENRLPPAFAQGKEGSCGPTSGSGLGCFLWPEHARTGFSRQLLYWFVRHKYEDTGDEDMGVETRDVLRAMTEVGIAPEDAWPYDQLHFAMTPTQAIINLAAEHKLASYSRLVQSNSMYNCLTAGFPFILGFMVPASMDAPELARSGVMPFPQPGEKILGGHDVLVVGFTLDFKNTPEFRRSGIDPARVSDRAFKIRNSWGTEWGLRGHFYMPELYATNPSTGGDAWTGRRQSTAAEGG